MKTEFIKELKIRFSETDNKGQFKIVSIFDCFQDVGSEHAAMLGISGADLMTQNYTWVMLRYNVTIETYPVWNETVTMHTWRFPHKNLYELREFVIRDKSGNLMIRGLSSWVMMNFESRKPVRLDRFIPESLMKNQMAVEDNFSRLAPLEINEYERIFNVRMQDIDFNNHVNNSVYIGWAVETVPTEVLLNYTLKQVEVNYLNEISYGNKIVSHARQADNANESVFLHSISGGGQQKELTRLRSVWQRDL